MAACKLRRGRMAKNCHTAAKNRGTTREAALALRLAEDERAAMGAQLQPITVRPWWQIRTAVAPSGVPSIAPAPPLGVTAGTGGTPAAPSAAPGAAPEFDEFDEFIEHVYQSPNSSERRDE
jgi:hypothetical protein